MRGGRPIVWLVLVVLGAGQASAQTPSILVPSPSTSSTEKQPACWDWLCGEACHPITSGNPDLNPALWQRTWGIAGLDVIPLGRKMAPNGVPYDPLFALDLLLNVALTEDREFYLFVKSRFWAQKPGEGITNRKQGNFDFSKRQFDLDGGLAWNFYGRMEARAFFYSFNNLNRGENHVQPRGYKDGFAVECRYYLPTTNFDNGLYRYLSLGFAPTKELVGADGRGFKPGFFATANLAFDVIPERFYTYADLEYISKRTFMPKLFIVDPGIAFRPFEKCNDIEFRIGAESTIDVDLAYTRTFLYGMVRIIW
jgi:hypothetical protein